MQKKFVYGSYARGDFDEDSDIDVAILTDCDRVEAKKYDDYLMDIVTEIAMKTNAIVEYICIPENEFSEKRFFVRDFKKEFITWIRKDTSWKK